MSGTPTMTRHGITTSMRFIEVVGYGKVRYCIEIESVMPCNIPTERTLERLADDFSLHGFREETRAILDAELRRKVLVQITFVIEASIKLVQRAAFLAGVSVLTTRKRLR